MKQREMICAPFLKNDGLKWNLHDISNYVNEAYDEVAADKECNDVLNEGLKSLKQGLAKGES